MPPHDPSSPERSGPFADGDRRPDVLVIASIRAGNRDDFDVLYRRYAAWVLRLARRFTGDEDAALDVLQETFIYLVRKLPTLTLSARLTTFLYPAVRNLAITAAKRRRRDRGSGEPGDAAGPRADPAPDPLGETRAALAGAVGALPEAQREVLLMRIVDGMGTNEIADALGIPAGTVKSRLHHAIAALRDDPRTRTYFGS